MRGRENWGRQDRVHEKMCPEPEVFHNVQVKEAGEIKHLRFRTTQILKRKSQDRSQPRQMQGVHTVRRRFTDSLIN